MTGKHMLEPVAETAVQLGLADGADIFTFTTAMDRPHAVERATKRQLTLTHSAGILAVTPHMSPEALVACNGPEPRSMGGLVLRSLVKDAHHLGHAITGPKRGRHMAVVADNALQISTQPYANLRHLRHISRFSTAARLAETPEYPRIAALAADDEFFDYPHGMPAGVDVVNHRGGHDALLVQPLPLLEHIVEAWGRLRAA